MDERKIIATAEKLDKLDEDLRMEIEKDAVRLTYLAMLLKEAYKDAERKTDD